MTLGKTCRCYLAIIFCIPEDSPTANEPLLVYTDPHPLTGKTIKGRKDCTICGGKGYLDN